MGNLVYWPVFFLIENWVFAHEQCLVLKYPILIKCLVLFFWFLLSPLIRLRRLESALTRHNQCELCFCSRLIAKFAYSQISLCVSYNLAHRDVLISLAVVLSGLEAERCEDQFAGVPLAHGRVAEECAYIHVLKLAAKFLQNDAALAHLTSLGLLAPFGERFRLPQSLARPIFPTIFTPKPSCFDNQKIRWKTIFECKKYKKRRQENTLLRGMGTGCVMWWVSFR